MTELLDVVAAETRVEELRQTNLRLLRQLEEQRLRKTELLKAVYDAARDAALNLAIPPVPPPERDTRKQTAEIAIAHLTDWQLGKVTDTYNSDVCAQRIRVYADKLVEITEIMRSHHPVRELRVYLTGDLVEGELIFPGQAHLVDASLFRQVLLDGPGILAEFLRRMLTVFDRVHVVSVIGNHGALGGRSRREYHPESNADAMMVEHTRQILAAEKRLTWASTWTAGNRHWYAIDKVGEHKFFLFHGDQVKGGFAGFPWYGFGKRLQGWALGAVPERFDYALCGHFHTPTRMTVSGITLWCGGSTESSNAYAAENLAAQGSPCQWLLFTHPVHGVTAEYLIHLDRQTGKRNGR